MKRVAPNRENKRSSPELKDLRDLPVKPATEYLAKDLEVPRSCPTSNGPTVSVDPELGAREMRFLAAVIENPGEPSSAYAKLTRMSSKTAVATRKRLVEMNLLLEEKLNAKERGRATILLRPTEAALRLFEPDRNKTQ